MQTPNIIENILERYRSEYCFSAYQLAVSRHGKLEMLRSGGATSYWPEAQRVTDATWFDIGSVTKVVVTTSVMARAVQRGDLALGDPLRKFLPMLVGSPLGNIEIQQALSHCTGLSGWQAIYKDLAAAPDTKLADWFVANASKLQKNTPGTNVEYSDLGMLLLKLVIERLWGSVETAFQEDVVTPLSLSEISFLPLPDNTQVAATEFCMWRQRLLQGEVFDENTAALGNVSSHAGLFATARELVKFGDRWLSCLRGENPWLNMETAKLFTSRSSLVDGSTWALGWDTKSAAFSSVGKAFSPTSFGHLGYPGCSLWVDPVNDVSIAFLTNRIHPSRVDERIKRIRPQVHESVAEHLGIISI